MEQREEKEHKERQCIIYLKRNLEEMLKREVTVLRAYKLWNSMYKTRFNKMYGEYPEASPSVLYELITSREYPTH